MMMELGIRYEIEGEISLDRIAGKTVAECYEYVEMLKQEGCRILSAWWIRKETDPWKRGE